MRMLTHFDDARLFTELCVAVSRAHRTLHAIYPGMPFPKIMRTEYAPLAAIVASVRLGAVARSCVNLVRFWSEGRQLHCCILHADHTPRAWLVDPSDPALTRAFTSYIIPHDLR